MLVLFDFKYKLSSIKFWKNLWQNVFNTFYYLLLIFMQFNNLQYCKASNFNLNNLNNLLEKEFFNRQQQDIENNLEFNKYPVNLKKTIFISKFK